MLTVQQAVQSAETCPCLKHVVHGGWEAAAAEVSRPTLQCDTHSSAGI